MGVRGIFEPDANDAARLTTEEAMSITSAQSYEMRIARKGDEISDPPQPYWQTVERLLADKGANHVACLLAYALNDLDKAQGKAWNFCLNQRHNWSVPADEATSGSREPNRPAAELDAVKRRAPALAGQDWKRRASRCRWRRCRR